MAVRKTKKSTTTTGTNTTIDQYFKIKTPTPTVTRNVNENFNSQPIEDDMKPLLSPERKMEKISKQIKRRPLAEINEPTSCSGTPFSMAISKKPSKPAFVVLRDEDIDNGVTEAQQPSTTSTFMDKSKESITQPDSLWTQSIPIGNTYNSQSSITSSPVHLFTQDSIQRLDHPKNENKVNNDKKDEDDEDDGIGIRIDQLDDDDDDLLDDDDPFFDDLDDPFIKKTNKSRIPYSTTFSNKRQCPFSVPSGLKKTSNSNRMLKNNSIFNKNDDDVDEEEEDEDDLFPADSLLFTSDNHSSKSGSMTSNSTRVDSTSTDDQEILDMHATSALNKNNIDSSKDILSSPIIEYSISDSMTFPIEYLDDNNDDDNNNNDNNNDNNDNNNDDESSDGDNKDNKKEKSDKDLQKQDNTNDTQTDNNNKIVNENDDEKEENENKNSPTSPSPLLKENIRSTVSSPTKSTILSPTSKSPLRSTHSSPIKSPFKSVLLSSPLSSTSVNTSQLGTLPISLPSDSSLDVHVAYPNPRGKSILEKFDISDN
ncbi:unnamed protein product [Cunninghamella blakesleeana]